MTAAGLIDAAREAGFHRAGLVDPAGLARWSGGVAQRAPCWMEPEWVLRPGDWSDSRTILVCALSCWRDEPDDLSTAGDPHALIAPFARRSLYSAAVAMMRGLLRKLGAEGGFAPRSARIFVNSGVPEKPLLASSGLGSYGKNGLVIVPGLGSVFVIAGCVISARIDPGLHAEAATVEAGAPVDFPPCGRCTRCMDACPVGAIVEPGFVDPGRCLQGLAERPIMLDVPVMERWGRRFYGCQDCQSVCPHNDRLSVPAPACSVEVGPSVSLRRLLAEGAGGMKEMFKGTPMGMGRIHPSVLVRNALIAAGNSREPALLGPVERCQSSTEPVLRDTARWALGRLG